MQVLTMIEIRSSEFFFFSLKEQNKFGGTVFSRKSISSLAMTSKMKQNYRMFIRINEDLLGILEGIQPCENGRIYES